jgi:penicillin-insensitive murein endopeptidase
VSIGNTSTGSLIRAARLPFRGKHHAVLPRWRKRRTNYGTEELLTLLNHAARRVARAYPGSRMMVGNLSLKHGGDISWSQSHNAGRDGDIAFYLKRGRRAVVPTALVKVDARLRALRARGVRFDVRRNWALVKTLLTHKTIGVQWIFIARHLKTALLNHARTRLEPAALLDRADKILRQPTDSLSHDDHFHVRIYCSGRDRLEGCIDRAPFWKGVQTHDQAVAKRIRILMAGLKDPDASIRLQVIAYLVRLQALSALDLRLVPALVTALEHPSGAVRRIAAGSLRRLTNHSCRVVWGRRLSKRRRQLLAQRWRRWWRKHRSQSREALVRRGFRRVSRRLRNLKTRRAQWLLVSYTRRRDHLGFNAHRMLRVLSGQRWCNPGPDNIGRRYQRWARWFSRKWRRYRRRRRRPRRRRLQRIRRRQHNPTR